MAKPILPPRRNYPGRSAMRVKPGEVIKRMMDSNPNGVTIGDCHRYYTKKLLEVWQGDEILKVMENSSDLRALAVTRHPRSPRRQEAFITRKEKAISRIRSRKRAPGTVTYANFSRFFHYLVQLKYISPIMTRDPVTKKPRRASTPPEMRGNAPNPGLPDAVLYTTAPDGIGQDWNNPRSQLGA